MLFAVMTSLAALWRACGVHPAAVVGHSQGEVAAAYTAGALSLEDAMRVVVLRSRILLALTGKGGVVSIGAPLDYVRAQLDCWPGLSIGGYNGPRSVGVVGDDEALAELVAACTADGVSARRVPATVASHCSQVDSLRGELLDCSTASSPGPRTCSFTRLSQERHRYRSTRRRVLVSQHARAGPIGSGHSWSAERRL